jgi:glycosyltransferase involved in cell wall biosynthesis
MVVNAASAKMGGAVTYLTNLLRYLPPTESGHEFYIFLPSEIAAELKGLNQSVKLTPTSAGHARWWKRLWWEQVTLRRCLRELHADALFSTANFGMFRCPVRQILLVRIALYFSRIYIDTFLPQHSLRFRLSFRLRRWLCCQSVRWADVVMTPTQVMRDDLRAYVDVSRAKGMVNHYGVAEAVDRGIASSRPRGEQSPIRLLYISLYAEHKNLATLLQALPLLNKDGIGKFVLVTTVNPAWKGASWTLTYRADTQLAHRQDIAPWLKFADPLGPKEIEEQYRRADIFVFPSLTESFGHPLVEAMAHGLPIVASDTRVNREICGDAAIYFSPLDPDHLAQAIRRVATNQPLRNRLSSDGQQRARARFRWDTHVRRILEIARAEDPKGFLESSEALFLQWSEEFLQQSTAKRGSLSPPDRSGEGPVLSAAERAVRNGRS